MGRIVLKRMVKNILLSRKEAQSTKLRASFLLANVALLI